MYDEREVRECCISNLWSTAYLAHDLAVDENGFLSKGLSIARLSQAGSEESSLFLFSYAG